MQVKEILKESQPVVYRVIENGFKNKKTSHAYLISGEKGMPVRQTALFLAQSFLCDSNETLACEECINCNNANQLNTLYLFFAKAPRQFAF